MPDAHTASLLPPPLLIEASSCAQPVSTPVLPGVPPRITVITPSFNQGRYLEATIRSVLQQGYPALEYFVIDGGSTDDSVRVLRHYEACLSGWVSEPDHGQADAIAKGMARASGEWINWINSDDLLAPGALWEIARLAPDSDVIAGTVEEFDTTGVRRQVRAHDFDFDHLLFEELGADVGWHQPGVWLRRQWLECAGGIDPSLHYRMDYDMLLRVLALAPRVTCTSAVLARFRLHEESKTGSLFQHSGLGAFRDEKLRVLAQLAQAPQLQAQWPRLQEALAKLTTDTDLQRLVADRSRSRWSRALDLIADVTRQPGRRWDASHRRALRRILLRGGHRAHG